MKFNQAYFLIFLFFILHLPFLTADPDTLVDVHTMGAWTDEGLYAAQARNYIYYGDFGMEDNTTFIRGPLQTLIQVPVFYFFGASLSIARLLTIVWVCVAFFFVASFRKWKLFTVFLLIFSFSQFRVFLFSHYALAEMMAISSLPVSFIFLSKYFDSGKLKFMFLSALMVFVSWSLKIQFLYFIVLPPMAIFFYNIMRQAKGEITMKHIIKDVIWVSAFSLLLVIIYLLIWYLPNKEFFDFIMFEQTEQRFDVWERIHLTFDFNLHYFILKPENYPLIIGSVVSLFLWVSSFFTARIKIKNQLVIIFGLAWLLIEFHKLGMTYLPQRYLLGLYVASGFFTSAVLFQFINLNKYSRVILWAMLAATLFYNGFYSYESYQRRTYELKAANNYLRNFDWDEKTIAGVWAPSITWKTKARVIPVWSEYADPETFFKIYKPSLIVEEPNEGSSGEFFKSNGFNLDEMSDSVRYFDFWRYELGIFWLNDSTRTAREQ